MIPLPISWFLNKSENWKTTDCQWTISTRWSSVKTTRKNWGREQLTVVETKKKSSWDYLCFLHHRSRSRAIKLVTSFLSSNQSIFFYQRNNWETVVFSIFIPGWGWGQHFFESRTGQVDCIAKAVLLSSVNNLSLFRLRLSCCSGLLLSNWDSAVAITHLTQQALSQQKSTKRCAWRSAPFDSALAFHILKEYSRRAVSASNNWVNPHLVPRALSSVLVLGRQVWEDPGIQVELTPIRSLPVVCWFLQMIFQ